MDGLIDQDIANFRAAMQRAGLDPDLKLGGVEMINALSKQYEKDVSLAHAASEFGLTSDELVERLAGAGGESFRLKRRLEQGVVPRDTFEPSFKAMLSNVTDDAFITVAAAAAPAAGDAAAPATTADGAAAAAPVATVAATKESPDVNRDFELALFSDKSEYAAGDLAVFTVTPKTDCNLTLINVDGKGIATVIFPNKFEPNNFVKAGQEVRLPGEAAPYQFRLKDPGTETVVAACNATTRSVDGIKQDFTKEAFTDLGVYKDFVTRAITIEQAAPKTEGKKASVEAAETGKISAKGDVLARTAVKFAVK
jgi:hypothetical protein